jgi:hypothetical protein
MVTWGVRNSTFGGYLLYVGLYGRPEIGHALKGNLSKVLWKYYAMQDL